jgi:hypothetical protein
MITVTSNLPPPISQYFNRYLLSTLMFKHDAEYLKQIGDALEYDINSSKYRKFPSTINKLKMMHQTFMELYERAKTQEGINEKEKGSKTGIFFYRIKLPKPNDRAISERLDEKRYRFQHKLRKLNEVS